LTETRIALIREYNPETANYSQILLVAILNEVQVGFMGVDEQ
jgi:hypothetical protein